MKPLEIDNNLFRYSFTFFSDKKKYLKNLINEKNRFENFSAKGAGVLFDFSKQLLDSKAMSFLLKMSEEKDILNKFSAMVNGEIVNLTENRPALHMLCRDTGSSIVDNIDFLRVKDEVKDFTKRVHSGQILSDSGEKFTDICVIGIGGSNLGTETVIKSLNSQKKFLKASFISSCDPEEFFKFKAEHNLKTTLFIIISKSYKTREVLVNEDLIRKSLKAENLDYKKQIVRITAKNSPGDNPESGIKSFHMFDSIGGRYSVSSAVGGLPVSLAYGFEVYERFLNGMNEMDNHVVNAAPEKNIAHTAAMIDIWNSVYLNYSTLAIIPYCSNLEKLPFHIQQLYMESNGKMFTEYNELIMDSTSMIIFGETGTKAQHSFFQLLHQGRVVPVEFIGFLEPESENLTHYEGVSGHQELWANLLAQSEALAFGRDTDLNEKHCPGNRPSTIITLQNTEPENIGKLISFYEARTILAGFLWDLNPFDQFGVELGKNIADAKRKLIKKANKDNKSIETESQSDNFYINAVARKKNNL
jgi:glucose-6-phosphate isomerase